MPPTPYPTAPSPAKCILSLSSRDSLIEECICLVGSCAHRIACEIPIKLPKDIWKRRGCTDTESLGGGGVCPRKELRPQMTWWQAGFGSSKSLSAFLVFLYTLQCSHTLWLIYLHTSLGWVKRSEAQGVLVTWPRSPGQHIEGPGFEPLVFSIPSMACPQVSPLISMAVRKGDVISLFLSQEALSGSLGIRWTQWTDSRHWWLLTRKVVTFSRELSPPWTVESEQVSERDWINVQAL